MLQIAICVWKCMESKGKIDYKSFAALFPFNPDNFLSSIIYGFAVARNTEVIANKMPAKVFMTGNTADKRALSRATENYQPILKKIAFTIKALNMLNDGIEPETIMRLC